MSATHSYFAWSLYCTLILCAATQGVHTTHSLRDLDRGEGAALHAHLFEEVIDWSEPIREQMK
jgi:hypothetical protein